MSGAEAGTLLPLLVGGGASAAGAGLNAAFGPNASTKPFESVESGGASVGPGQLLRGSVLSADDLFQALRDRASGDITLGSAGVQALPTFTGGSLPFPVGATGQDPALSNPGLLTSEGAPSIGAPSDFEPSLLLERGRRSPPPSPGPPPTLPDGTPVPTPFIPPPTGGMTQAEGEARFGPTFTADGMFRDDGSDMFAPQSLRSEVSGLLGVPDESGSLSSQVRQRLSGGGGGALGGLLPGGTDDLDQAEGALNLLTASFLPPPRRG